MTPIMYFEGIWGFPLPSLFPGAPNGSVPQNMLAGRFGRIDMSLEGKVTSEIDNSGFLRGFGV